MSADLAGRITVVVGRDRDLGREWACQLGRRGATLVIGGDAMDFGHRTVELVRGLSGEAGFCYGNLSDATRFQSLLDYTSGEFGRIELVIMTPLDEPADSITACLERLAKFAQQQSADISVVISASQPDDDGSLTEYPWRRLHIRRHEAAPGDNWVL